MQKFILFIGDQWILFSLLAATVALLAWFENRRSGRSLTPHALTSMLNKEDAVVLDLRDRSEFEAGHIVNSINLPFSKWQAEQAKGGASTLEAYKDKSLVLVCKLGQQSSHVAKKLQGQEFTQVCRLAGGITEWQNAQMPLVK